MIALGNQPRYVDRWLELTEINGHPEALAHGPDGHLISVLSIDMAVGQIQAFRNAISPPKTQHLGPLADLAELQRQRAGPIRQPPDG